MAKAREVPIDPTDPAAQAAARIVRVRAQEVFDHAHRVLDTADVEGVHDMRVASRRLRAVLEMFDPCFPAKRRRKALRQVRRLARALGARRDADVHLEALADFPGAGPERLVLALRTEQARANEELHDALLRAQRQELLRRLVALAEDAERAPPGAPLADVAESVARARLDELLAADARDPAGLHEMRIAAKRLRYVLDVTHPCFGPYAAEAAGVVKSLQEVLGDIHDADVQLPRIRRFAENAVDATGLDAVVEQLERRRAVRVTELEERLPALEALRERLVTALAERPGAEYAPSS